MTDFNPDLDLAIEREMRARPETIWRCWSEPDLFKQWFTPPSVDVIEVENDLRPGGRAYNVMRLPDGSTIPNDGSFVLADPCTRLVYTDAMLAGFRPTASAPFMSVDLRLIAKGDGVTLYKAHVMHATPAQRAEHLRMGFEEGWGVTLGQLADLAERID